MFGCTENEAAYERLDCSLFSARKRRRVYFSQKMRFFSEKLCPLRVQRLNSLITINRVRNVGCVFSARLHRKRNSLRLGLCFLPSLLGLLRVPAVPKEVPREPLLHQLVEQPLEDARVGVDLGVLLCKRINTTNIT